MITPGLFDPASRCTTGVAGLDEVLGGGLPRNRLYLVQGDPGVGKTTLALQFLLEGARLGEVVLYIALSETREEMATIAASHDWNLGKINLFELSVRETQLANESETTFFHPSEVELNRTTLTLIDEINRINPSRVVFDSLSELRMLADTPLRYRRQLLQLKHFFSGRQCTALCLDDRNTSGPDLQVESIAYGVITIKRSSPEYGMARRRLQIQKVRGAKFLEGYHDLTLKKGGLVVFPRLVAANHTADFKRESISSGIRELDALLGGGLDRGTSTMFMGPPGTGKSTLAARFAYAAVERGEKALIFAFDEAIPTLLSRSRHLGMDLEPHVARGTVRIEQIDPAEISPGEFAHNIRQAVTNDGVRLVVIDSINGYMNAMPEERDLALQLHEILTFLNQRGVATIMILAQQGIVGAMQSSVNLTYLADSIVLLRFFEARGAIKQALSVVKKRSGTHERTIREFSIDDDGLRVGPPLDHMRGVLSGIPIFETAPALAEDKA